MLLAALGLGGCGLSGENVTPERLDCGLVIILPGIEGEGPLSHGVREGLLDAGVDLALAIHQWGRPVPLAGPLLNQMDIIGNRLAGARIAQLIMDYQDSHPAGPVYIVGHSGGGGVAVFAAEALPDGRDIQGLILLSPSISSGYDLTKALGRCRNGIVNFYSKGDVGLLVVGTTLFGNVDGVRGPAAGAVGFSKSLPDVYQVGWDESMVAAGHDGSHTGVTNVRFVKTHIASWVKKPNWPAW
ncbi:MAG: hypothetical protein AMJ81_13605 [Phycisphaerae bacterium SM23_33]|nr:MAG: hypothetical protein AMJ81_13605 [Phycisphaerae bacterium SM23_33]